MRTVTYGGAVSLDGYLAAPDGAIDWLHFSKDVQQITTDYFKDVDAILMGRKTWAVAAAQAPAASGAPKRARKRAASEPAMRTYVFSRTLVAIDAPGVELVSTDAADFVRDLKQRPTAAACSRPTRCRTSDATPARRPGIASELTWRHRERRAEL